MRAIVRCEVAANGPAEHQPEGGDRLAFADDEMGGEIRGRPALAQVGAVGPTRE